MKRSLPITVWFIVLIVCLKLLLGIYGINWGNPDRWNVDDRLTAALRMVSEKTFFYSSIQSSHPVFYYYFLLSALLPYFLFLKLTGFDFYMAKKAALISWLSFTRACPDLANGLLIAGKLSSLLLGVGTILIIFLLARKIYGNRIALFSAIILTLNVGLVGTNHLIKNENLAIFLVVLVIYIWTSILKNKFSYKKFYLSCFLSGLAIGTKLDSAILLFGISFTILYCLRTVALNMYRNIGLILASCIFVSLGVLAGYPRFIVPVKVPGGVVEGAVGGFSVLFCTPGILNTLEQTKMVAMNLASSFNILISIFLVLGVAFSLTKLKTLGYHAYLLLSIFIPYFIINIFFYKFTATKLLVLSLPFLAIFAGLGFELFWKKMALHKPMRAILSILMLIYSVIYVVRADMVFAKDDTRYISTRWVEKNIHAGASIAIVQEPELLFSSRLVGEYAIYYGEERLSYDNNPYTKPRTGAASETALLKNLSGYDYAIVSSWNHMAFETGGKDRMEEMLLGNKGYALVKAIEYNENLLFNPRPSYTCPAIFIFKKINGNKATLTRSGS